MWPIVWGKRFPGGFLTTRERLWIRSSRQLSKTGWCKSPVAQRLQPPSIHTAPREQGWEPSWEAHKDGVNAGTPHVAFCSVWLTEYHAEINTRGKARGMFQSRTGLSTTAGLSPHLIPFHPQASLFICTGNSCLNISPSGKETETSNIYSINRNI